MARPGLELDLAAGPRSAEGVCRSSSAPRARPGSGRRAEQPDSASKYSGRREEGSRSDVNWSGNIDRAVTAQLSRKFGLLAPDPLADRKALFSARSSMATKASDGAGSPLHQLCANFEATDAVGRAGVPPKSAAAARVPPRDHGLCNGPRRRRQRIILLHDSGDEPNEKEAEARILVVELEDLVLGDRIKVAVDCTDRAHGAHPLPRE
jgi:hypothetical protein